MKERLNYLYGFEQNNNNKKSSDFDGIEISYIFNKLPKIEIKKPISIEENDHILVSGESGSGKTTLLYILKGLVKAEKIRIEPNINDITNKAFLTLPNHKNLFDGYSWDIITNFEKEPDINLINQAIEKSKTSIKKENYWINIEKLSNGERIRLLLARIIYIAKKKDYKILLFDEIDESLNEKLGVEVCKNLLEIFDDRIILYITHHEKVKALFNKRLSFKKGILTEQF
jgi:ABC-type bacteriocin/lantibiotic exporter with double-glycine peptidase domain